MLCASLEAAAQNDVAQATRKASLQSLAGELKERDVADRRQAIEYARAMGIPKRRELPNGGVMELQRYTPGLGPVFYITNNLDAADTVSTLKVWPGGSAGLDLDGSGMIVGEWDGGAIYADHPDFIGRLTQVDGATEVSGHSTHVAGTLFGSGEGLEPRSRGMAYAAQLHAWDWNSDTAEMALAAAGGLLTSNHSYGIAAGWLYIGDVPPNTWWWIGGAADTDVEDPNFGYYDSISQLWDQIAYDAPYYLIVKASGNDRTDTGPSPGEEYTVIDQDGNPLFTSTLPRNADCAPAGYDCLPTNSVAKNVLTVGAVDDVPGGYSPLAGPAQVQMAPFSSWGPSDDGRIKPDLVGNGVFLISAWPDPPYYAAAAGTSMAAPNVTGSLLLLQEHYEDLHGAGNFMRSATLKALAIHTADEAGEADGPDYAYGWGLLNTSAAATVISGDGGNHRIIEGSLAQGATDTVQFTVSEANSVLTATLVWMDPPGTPVPLTLDAPDLMLVNDLDLRIVRNPTIYMPWVLDPANPAAAATRGDNFRDNVEHVEISGAATGTYTVQVSHKGTLLNGVNQPYSLVISMTPALPSGSNLVIDEDFSGGLPAGWSVNTVEGIDWTINSPVPGDSRLDNGTGGTGNFAMVDNGWANQTITSLQTPVLDLSGSSAVVLRFKSYYNYDTFESLNVDVSTNGGGSWVNSWHFQGFNPLPTPYQLDLSGTLAGQGNAMVRFRFDSEGWLSGDFWQIDDVELDDFGGTPEPGNPPGAASNPSPADGATNIGPSATLGWSAGADTNTHDVYFGTDSTPDAGEFQANQTGITFDPGMLASGTTYYWRIDEVNDIGTTAGTVWSFTTEPASSSAFHIAAVVVQTENVKGPRNRGIATITVQDEGALPVEGVSIEGTFSGDWSGTLSGTTNGSGQLILTTPPVKNAGNFDFCVETASKAGAVFDETSSAIYMCGAPPPPAATGSIAGVVTDSGNGNPIQGASVNADSGQSDLTDAAGAYVLTNVPTGSRTVSFSATGYEPASSSTSVSENTTSTLDISLTTVPVGGGTGTLKGTVMNATGLKISGALVQVIGGPGGSTNKGGKYSVQTVPEGPQTVIASHPDYADTTPVEVIITAGATMTLNITFDP